MRRLRGIWSTLREIRSYSTRDKIVVALGSLAMVVLVVLGVAGLIENLVFGRREDSALGPLYLGGMVLIIALCALIILVLQPWTRESRNGLSRTTSEEPPQSEESGDG